MNGILHVTWKLTLLCGLFVGLCGCGSSESQSMDYPRRPIKLIVPFGAGGGSDTFGRIIQRAVEKHQLLSQPLVIVNVPGAGGTVGSRRVKNSRPDGYTLLLLHEGILTAKHAGQSTFGPEAFSPIVGTGDATQVIAVAGDSPFQTLAELVDEASEKPDSLVFSANIGAPSHFAGLMLEAQSPGARFRYTQNGGGAKRFAALQGGHVDVSAFSIAEYVQFRESGMRALALLGPERHDDLADLPTALEQGFDVISQNMQFWWAPLGTPSNRIDVIAEAIGKAMKTPEVMERMEEMKITGTVLRSTELVDEIARRESRIASVATLETVALPSFPSWALALLVLTGILALVRTKSRTATAMSGDLTSKGASVEFMIVACLTIGYVAVFQFGWSSFVPATMIYVIACSLTLLKNDVRGREISFSKSLATISILAVSMSFALHYLFTQILTVDLP